MKLLMVLSLGFAAWFDPALLSLETLQRHTDVLAAYAIAYFMMPWVGPEFE